VDRTNLLYVVTKLELGGAQTQLLSLIENIDKTKYSVFLFTARRGMLWPDVLKLCEVRCRRSMFLDRAISPILDVLAFFELLFFIKSNSIEIVHTHSSKAGIIGRFAALCSGVKFIYHTVHGWSFNDFQPSFVRFFYLKLERIAASFTTRIIVVSEYDKLRGISNRIAQSSRFEVVRYGIDIAAFENARPTLRQERKIGESVLIVGMVACFKPQKSVQDFITVARAVCETRNDVVFVVVGDGSLRPAIEKLILSFGLNNRVILLGWRRDIASVVSSFDVFVLTSKWEGMPIAVIEAMAASKPAVVTNTGGIAEVIRDRENGFLEHINDMRSTIDDLKLLLSDMDLRRKIGRQARMAVSLEYTIQHMVSKTSQLYNH
jgi:glycosyltransferase involved in cell wall biosynthesis